MIVEQLVTVAQAGGRTSTRSHLTGAVQPTADAAAVHAVKVGGGFLAVADGTLASVVALRHEPPASAAASLTRPAALSAAVLAQLAGDDGGHVFFGPAAARNCDRGCCPGHELRE